MPVTTTLCDSCKTTSARLFCRADSAFLCIPCDGKVHAANKLASRHARVWLCEVCEQAPASVTCKADAAALCVTCDHEIHSVNPLARRHERVPVTPFYEVASTKGSGSGENNDHPYLLDFDVNVAGTEAEEAEAEAASWLLPHPNINKIANGFEDDKRNLNIKVTDPEQDYFFHEMDPFADTDLKAPEQKANPIHGEGYGSPTDGVVPVQIKSNYQMPSHAQYAPTDVVEGLPAYDVDYAGSKPFLYNFNSQSISQSVSSSSLEVGVVPDHNATMMDVSNNNHHPLSTTTTEVYPTPLVGFDREARVLRYKEKRKNRKFEKTIRYASRKAYAETRPRIKGRFAKRTDDLPLDSSYGLVPSY